MKRAALVLALVACGEREPPPPDASPPAVLVDPAGPVAGLAPCATAAALDATPTCRVDGHADLDADGAVDCWRASADFAGNGHVLLWIWPRCEGAPVEIAIASAAVMEVVLPEALRTAAWARGIAGVLAPSPSGEVWKEGAPTASAEAAVLDSHAIVVRDPGFDTPGVEPELIQVATCDAWQVWTARNQAAVVDRANGRWSVIHTGTGLGEAACTDDVVILTERRDAGVLAIRAIAPRTGRSLERVITGTDWRPMFERGVLATQLGMLSVRQLGGLLATPEVAPGPCPDGPLLALAPGPPCTREGREDIDRDGKEDCWTASRDGTAAAGTLAWSIQIDLRCAGAPVPLRVDTNHVVTLVELPVKGARWLGTLLAGADHFGCLPLPKKKSKKPPGCPVPGPAAMWIHDRLRTHGGRDLGSGLTMPVWQSGVPARAPPSATYVTDLPMWRGPTLMLHHPNAEPVIGPPLSVSSSCERFEVWAGPVGGAVVDHATGLWTWAYLATESTILPGRSSWWPAPVGRGRCEGETAHFELPSAQQTVVTQPLLGTWKIVESSP